MVYFEKYMGAQILVIGIGVISPIVFWGQIGLLSTAVLLTIIVAAVYRIRNTIF